MRSTHPVWRFVTRCSACRSKQKGRSALSPFFAAEGIVLHMTAGRFRSFVWEQVFACCMYARFFVHTWEAGSADRLPLFRFATFSPESALHSAHGSCELGAVTSELLSRHLPALVYLSPTDSTGLPHKSGHSHTAVCMHLWVHARTSLRFFVHGCS